MKKLICLLFACLLFSDCSKKDDGTLIQPDDDQMEIDVDTINTTVDTTGTNNLDKPLTYYTENPDRLVADYDAPDGSKVFFFGDLDVAGDPDMISTIVFQQVESDTTIFFQFNESKRPEFIYFEVNGQKVPTVFNIDYNDQDSIYTVSVIERNWATNENILLTQIDLIIEEGAASSDFAFIRDNFFTENWEAIVFVGAAVVLGALVSAALTGPVGVSIGITLVNKWAAAIVGAAVTFAVLSSPLYAEDPNYADQIPSEYPINISQNENFLNEIQLNGACSNSDLDFDAVIDNDGNVTFVTSGGVPPYKYSVDGSLFQSSNNLITTAMPGEEAFLMVRDNDGCVAVKPQNVGMGGGPCNTTSLAVFGAVLEEDDLQIFADGGTPPYQYSIDGGQSYSSSDIFNEIPSSMYTGIEYSIFVKDQNDDCASGEFYIERDNGIFNGELIVETSNGTCDMSFVDSPFETIGTNNLVWRVSGPSGGAGLMDIHIPSVINYCPANIDQVEEIIQYAWCYDGIDNLSLSVSFNSLDGDNCITINETVSTYFGDFEINAVNSGTVSQITIIGSFIAYK